MIAPIVAILLSLRYVAGIDPDAVRFTSSGPAAAPTDQQGLSIAAFDIVAIAMTAALSWFVLRRPIMQYSPPTTRAEPRGRGVTDSPLWDRDLDARP